MKKIKQDYSDTEYSEITPLTVVIVIVAVFVLGVLTGAQI